MKKMSYNVSAHYAAETHSKNRLKADVRLSVGILSGRNRPSYLTNDKPGYGCVQYVKMEVLATAYQKNREKELSFQREQQLSSHSYCTVFIDCERS